MSANRDSKAIKTLREYKPLNLYSQLCFYRRERDENMNPLSVFDGCWISPEGNVVNVSFMRHAQAAQDILQKFGKFSDDMSEAEKTLCTLKWLHVGLNYINGNYNTITDEQVNALFAVSRSCGKSLAQAIDKYIQEER
jgi:hypothetical protein